MVKRIVSEVILLLFLINVPCAMSNTTLSTTIHQMIRVSSSCPSIERAEGEEIFVMAYPSDIGEMNPLFSRSERTGWYLIQVYDSLIAYDAEMNPIPWLAEDWDISEDGANFTFYLREGLKWHDNVTLNASDIKFTLEYIKAAPEDANYWSLLQKMVDCTVLDEYSVSVVFNETMGFGLMQVGGINILPKHIRDWGGWEHGNSQHAACWDDPDNVTAHTGSGPFKFVERFPDEYILLEKNLDWWGKEPNVDGIRIEVIYGQSARILAMRQGTVDTERYELVRGADIQAVLDAPELELITGLARQWDYVLGFNLTIPGLNDPIVRKAIYHALNRTEIIETARGGYGTATWTTIPEAFYPAYYCEEGRFPEQNITYANQLLYDAGYLDTDEDGIRNFPGSEDEMVFDMQVLSWDTISVDAGTAISGQLAEIGISITVSITDDAVMYPNIYALPRDYRMYEMSHGLGGYPDHVWERMHSDNDINWGDNCYGLHNDTMDAALDDLLHANNSTAGTEAAEEVQKLSLELAPYIPLFLSDDTHAIRKEWVNYTFVPGGIFTSVNRLTMLNIYSIDVPEERVIGIVDAETGLDSITLGSETEPMPPEGYPFTVNVTLDGLTENLACYQIAVSFNQTKVECTAAWVPETDPNFVFYDKSVILGGPKIFDDLGYILLGVVLQNISNPVTVSQGLFCQINFTAIKNGTSTLGIIPTLSPDYPDDTFLWDDQLEYIPFTSQSFSIIVTTSQSIAVTDVTPSKTVVGQGYSMNITVTIENHGDKTKTFNVSTHYNETAIILPNGKNYTTITLTSGNSTIVTFTWNTTNVPKGNYTISVYVAPADSEIDTSDNYFPDGWVFVTIAGDVTSPDGPPDGMVNMSDIDAICSDFGANPYRPLWNPNFDINDDGKVNMRDIVIACDNFMETFE